MPEKGYVREYPRVIDSPAVVQRSSTVQENSIAD